MTAKTDLTPRQQVFVAVMVAGMTQEEAAQSIGVRVRTCRRYRADPRVRAAIKVAQDDALGGVTRRMNAGSNEALDVLKEVMQDKAQSGGVRIRAAQVWLETSFKVRELLDLAERVSELEQRMEVQR